ncbi:MAG: tyrosine-type recombinase/integrase [Pyramidobacter sp.]|nr:tyrosine-type recombinase/integrase [Pyramidobacter sp.]
MLSETKILRLAVLDRRYMVCDGDCLYIEVLPSGKKTWIFRQRKKDASIKKTLGHYPAMSLREARAARDALREERRGRKSEMTFRMLAELRMTKKVYGILSERHSQKLKTRYEQYIFPFIGDIPVSDLTAAEVLQLVQRTEEVSPNLAHCLLGMIGQALRFGVSMDVVASDVTRDLRNALKVAVTRHRASTTDPAQISRLMRAIKQLPDGVVKYALLLQAYTFVRPGELQRAEWKEFDLAGSLWRIPAEKMKKRRPHIVPLSRQSVDILKKMQALRRESNYVFVLRGETHISDVTLLNALRRLGFDKNEMSLHGFRSMASTTLNEHGWSSDLIELQLSHVEGNNVRAAYNFAEHLDRRRDMMQWYSNYLDTLPQSEEVFSLLMT